VLRTLLPGSITPSGGQCPRLPNPLALNVLLHLTYCSLCDRGGEGGHPRGPVIYIIGLPPITFF